MQTWAAVRQIRFYFVFVIWWFAAACSDSSPATSDDAGSMIADRAIDTADAAGDVSRWWEATRLKCQACCASLHPDAATKFNAYNMTCACQPSICGPIRTA